ncbi:MAG TPA: chemotaxis protein CheW [Verrucomicrobiae bacterium]|nr:chemotaxis protein CheW [Verrucomicrobiae bacterium]
MLFLIFQLGNDRYALEADRVIEVLPLVELKSLPHAPRGVAGIFNLRGRPVPAVDLSELSFGTPSRERLTTRIIVIEHTDGSGQSRPLGLIAEQVTQTVRKETEDFIDSGVSLSSAPYLGPVFMDHKGPVRWLYAQRLISEPIRELLSAGLPVSCP